MRSIRALPQLQVGCGRPSTPHRRAETKNKPPPPPPPPPLLCRERVMVEERQGEELVWKEEVQEPEGKMNRSGSGRAKGGRGRHSPISRRVGGRSSRGREKTVREAEEEEGRIRGILFTRLGEIA